jgi:hypothetical protein
MKTTIKTTITALTLALLFGSQAFAGESQDCSARMLAGRWMFATDVGKRTFFPGGDITAIGTPGRPSRQTRRRVRRHGRRLDAYRERRSPVRSR